MTSNTSSKSMTFSRTNCLSTLVERLASNIVTCTRSVPPPRSARENDAPTLMFVAWRQALTLVKRRRSARGVDDDADEDNFGVDTRPNSKRLDTVVDLQREVEKLQVERLALVQENQRCERMLELQVGSYLGDSNTNVHLA